MHYKQYICQFHITKSKGLRQYTLQPENLTGFVVLLVDRVALSNLHVFTLVSHEIHAIDSFYLPKFTFYVLVLFLLKLIRETVIIE